MSRYLLAAMALISPYALSANTTPETCHLAGNKLSANSTAAQVNAYDPSCVLKTGTSSFSSNLVPIGKNGKDEQSRVSWFNDDSILLSLGGAADNTLHNGRRGRQELSNCYLSSNELQRLTPQELQFREVASDMYRNCQQASGRYAGYTFQLSLEDSPAAPYTTWDAVIMQLHSVDDKDRYCLPNGTTPKDLCNQHSGVVSTSTRDATAYNALVKKGAIFEGGIQPPLSVKVKDGYFSIVATSSLSPPKNQLTEFSAGKGCQTKKPPPRLAK